MERDGKRMPYVPLSSLPHPVSSLLKFLVPLNPLAPFRGALLIFP